ncbi:MAG: cytochrome c biogenesis protein [Phycisphaerales bacterium JB063]
MATAIEQHETDTSIAARVRTLLPYALSLVLVGWLLSSAARTGSEPGLGGYDYAAFGALPVSEDGRIKPMDTVARNTLLQISGKLSLVEEMLINGEDEGLPAVVWMAEVVSQHPNARERPVFRIDDPDVLGLMGKTVDDGKYYSLAQIFPSMQQIEEEALRARELPDEERSRFQEHVIGLWLNVGLVMELQFGMRPYMLPPVSAEQDWQPLFERGAGGQEPQMSRAARSRSSAQTWAEMALAYAEGDASRFNQRVEAHASAVRAAQGAGGDFSAPSVMRKAGFEQGFNAYRPFAKGIVLYTLAGLIGLVGLLLRPMIAEDWYKTVWRSGVGVLIVAFLLHTAGLLIRMWLQGRPPVTNLYSSAVFIGWAAVGFAIATELLSRLGIASLASSIVGVGTLFIAHNLAKDGDTMGVMQAVLDSNFWLGTHVITVTLGYAATFFAGFLAILYLLLGLATPLLDKKSARLLVGMVYGTVCFALLFSFVGTVLGGIWADQSWGRFWGWDPKENGAVMIVLMNAITLHARWGHLVRERGVMCLAVLGNIITAWSWFGTNLLGVGLHAYGFMDGAMTVLMVVAANHLVLIAVALIVPTGWWRMSLRASYPASYAPPMQLAVGGVLVAGSVLLASVMAAMSYRGELHLLLWLLGTPLLLLGSAGLGQLIDGLNRWADAREGRLAGAV